VGCLIPDELYSEAWEGRGFSTIAPMIRFDERGRFLYAFLTRFKFMLYELLLLHDKSEPQAWEAGLRAIAYRRGLSQRVISEHELRHASGHEARLVLARFVKPVTMAANDVEESQVA
jgi:hypothetical protein